MIKENKKQKVVFARSGMQIEITRPSRPAMRPL